MRLGRSGFTKRTAFTQSVRRRRIACSGNIGPSPNARLRPPWSWPITSGGKGSEGERILAAKVKVLKPRGSPHRRSEGRHPEREPTLGTGGPRKCSLDEFIDRWAKHIPEPYQHAVRSFGLFAPRGIRQTSAA